MNGVRFAALLVTALAVGLLSGQSERDERSAAAGQKEPDFYDEPSFVVAGVANTTDHGTHGSDAGRRSVDALTNATASLKTDAPESGTGAAMHHALAEKYEKEGDALGAVREFQQAAEMDPSELNLFDWGVELLRHHAVKPSVEVFGKGNRLFPGSIRMLLGLGVALYADGSYEQAAKQMYEATQLDPVDPRPYAFLSNLQRPEIVGSAEYLATFRQYLRLRPTDALANYYCASALSKDSSKNQEAKQILEKAAEIDPKLEPVYLLLGTMEASENNFTAAIADLQKAIEISPESAEAHYRLAQAYRHMGQKSKQEKELERYRQLAEKSARDAERQTREVQQFVIQLQNR